MEISVGDLNIVIKRIVVVGRHVKIAATIEEHIALPEGTRRLKHAMSPFKSGGSDKSISSPQFLIRTIGTIDRKISCSSNAPRPIIVTTIATKRAAIAPKDDGIGTVAVGPELSAIKGDDCIRCPIF